MNIHFRIDPKIKSSYVIRGGLYIFRRSKLFRKSNTTNPKIDCRTREVEVVSGGTIRTTNEPVIAVTIQPQFTLRPGERVPNSGTLFYDFQISSGVFSL